jgi:hypothetical protein
MKGGKSNSNEISYDLMTGISSSDYLIIFMPTKTKTSIMKKFLVLSFLSAIIFLFSNCGGSKKLAAPPKMTYESNVQTLIAANCAPCHIPSRGGNKRPLDNYASVKTNIDEIVKRIEMQPTDRGFMPFKRGRLSDSVINVIKQWRTDGTLEK